MCFVHREPIWHCSSQQNATEMVTQKARGREVDPGLIFYVYVFPLWTEAINHDGKPSGLLWLGAGVCFHL